MGGFAWCLTVDNGTLMVRRNGKVCVTQNTHNLADYSQVYFEVSKKDKKVIKKKKHYILTGGFLNWKGSYAETKAYAPLQIGCAKATLSGKKYDVHIRV